MSFFDNLSGFAGDVGGFAGQLSQSISQVAGAIHSVQGSVATVQGGWGGINLPPPTPHLTNQPIGPPTSATSPLLLVGIAGLAIYIATRK